MVFGCREDSCNFGIPALMSHQCGWGAVSPDVSRIPDSVPDDWHVVSGVTDKGVKAVHFFDDMVGYAVGGGLEGGVILKTITGGWEWHVLSIGIWQLQAVRFVTAEIGWASGYDLGC